MKSIVLATAILVLSLAGLGTNAQVRAKSTFSSRAVDQLVAKQMAERSGGNT
jgi:hypothetical protein